MNLLRPRARKLLLDALWEQSGARQPPHRPGAGRRAALLLRRGRHLRGRLHRLPRRLVAGADPGGRPGAMADERRLGRWARRILNPGEVRKVARSLKRDGSSVHDIALLDELQAILGAPARPRKKRELDPLDQLTGLEELMPVARGVPARAGRAAGARSAPSTRTSSSTRPRTSPRCSGAWSAAAAGTPPGRSSATRPSPPGPTPTRRPRPATRPSAPARAAASSSP